MGVVLSFWSVVAVSTVAIMYADNVWLALPIAWLTASVGVWLQRMAYAGRKGEANAARVQALLRSLAK